MIANGRGMSFNTNSGDLLTQLKAGRIKAFDIIYQLYFPKLHLFVNSYLHNSDNSKDIVQNVFTKLWQNKEKLRENTNLEAWLFTIAKNETLSFLEHKTVENRHRQSERERLLKIDFLALKEVQLSEIAYMEISRIVQATLEKLPRQCKAVFICSRYMMMSNKEIASLLSISIKTVEAHMTKALKVLRAVLKDYI